MISENQSSKTRSDWFELSNGLQSCKSEMLGQSLNYSQTHTFL
ncbi:hypothetical protein HMPREF9381_0939 [Streptococcus sanguinis SK72]|uniref:Uncharacterized protein n=2 Tax=Streptococcus sanguinis TaxID=1305 RepID=F0I1W7_STRSA|nr:hypothetical protein HMPREF9388_0762 [Streptococcus sanguinis SK353]EGD29426.1 hypothetical protein HMPREF9381_0939 [Streptococcus sanguinis SK72]